VHTALSVAVHPPLLITPSHFPYFDDPICDPKLIAPRWMSNKVAVFGLTILLFVETHHRVPTHWHTDTLTHWHTDTLTHWHTTHWHTDTLTHDTLTHWHTDTLTSPLQCFCESWYDPLSEVMCIYRVERSWTQLEYMIHLIVIRRCFDWQTVRQYSVFNTYCIQVYITCWFVDYSGVKPRPNPWIVPMWYCAHTQPMNDIYHRLFDNSIKTWQ